MPCAARQRLRPLPSLEGCTETVALDEMVLNVTSLDRTARPFAARILPAQATEKALDVQYYIWRKDLTGIMMFKVLRKARRQRHLQPRRHSVRTGCHPNIGIRLFNPFVLRQIRLLGFATDFSRVNRHILNKFTADNQATILAIGESNIGDEYFGAADGVLFADLECQAPRGTAGSRHRTATPVSSPSKSQGSGKFSSSGSSLHAKTFTIDCERIFIGPFNFDPRSARLNTELGFIIDSPAMAPATAPSATP